MDELPLLHIGRDLTLRCDFCVYVAILCDVHGGHGEEEHPVRRLRVDKLINPSLCFVKTALFS